MDIFRHRKLVDYLESALLITGREEDRLTIANPDRVEWITCERLIAAALRYAKDLQPPANP